ncbi:TPA: Asp-tRNA(Asn)/Glu-tRNA(Gln) amidotransferase subunit GatB [Candidatus Gracilibacteria bacterium]|nr:Asp-tRNA(Asn)/Glu-tRNA(Gln) amidotransferase subunit GatB [Candidatus Gracilibacteria bacterium]HIQ57619.1 Asp-tRNA(Asn)/Glu-tRNA(Gln) amidotransferase subunit GatB [Candidatus Gracilibacteria bacterium]
MTQKYEPVIGLEIHARLKSKTKMFCACSNNTWKSEPNEHTCPICMGFPGSLPTINKEAVYLGRKMGAALGCEIKKFSKFDRKSYFYPDLPLGFQTSQFDEPVCEHGNLQVIVSGEKKSFRINRLHLENDAGKSTHSAHNSLLDWNRAGSPLAEMVTEADFRSPTDVSAFLKEVQRILRLLDISDADMDKGMMRCDVNVSIRPFGQEKFGTKVEMKNMNSFRNIEKALEFEIDRQTKLCNAGKKDEIVQETRGFNPDTGKTFSQRSKEEAMDYRYFPEPDLPPLIITQEEIDALQKEIPELPSSKILRYLDAGIGIAEADALVNDKYVNAVFEFVSEKTEDMKITSNWVLGALSKYLNDNLEYSLVNFNPENLVILIQLIQNNKISNKIANQIFDEMISENKNPEEIVEAKGLAQESDTGAIEIICKEVLEEKSDLVEAYKSGKDKLFGAFVGQVMKKSKGKANPQVVNELLKKLLS